MQLFHNFFMAIEPTLVAFIAVVVPALGLWIVNQLKTNHETAILAATASAHASAELNKKADLIQENTDGITSKLQDQIKAQMDSASHLADITIKDKVIAHLTEKLNTLSNGKS